MNTPPTPKRWSMTDGPLIGGSWTPGCHNITILAHLGAITAYWSHVESASIDVFIELSGITNLQNASVIMKSIISARGRADMLKKLLQISMFNEKKDSWYDEFNSRFSKLISQRNKYIHGTWWTVDETGSVILAPTEGYSFDDIENAREVSVKELESFFIEATEFVKWVRAHSHALGMERQQAELDKMLRNGGLFADNPISP